MRAQAMLAAAGSALAPVVALAAARRLTEAGLAPAGVSAMAVLVVLAATLSAASRCASVLARNELFVDAREEAGFVPGVVGIAAGLAVAPVCVLAVAATGQAHPALAAVLAAPLAGFALCPTVPTASERTSDQAPWASGSAARVFLNGAFRPAPALGALALAAFGVASARGAAGQGEPAAAMTLACLAALAVGGALAPAAPLLADAWAWDGTPAAAKLWRPVLITAVLAAASLALLCVLSGQRPVLAVVLAAALAAPLGLVVRLAYAGRPDGAWRDGAVALGVAAVLAALAPPLVAVVMVLALGLACRRAVLRIDPRA